MVLLYAFGAFDPCVANDHCRGDTIAASFSPANLLPVLGIFVLNFTHQHVSSRIVDLSGQKKKQQKRSRCLHFFRTIINYRTNTTTPFSEPFHCVQRAARSQFNSCKYYYSNHIGLLLAVLSPFVARSVLDLWILHLS